MHKDNKLQGIVEAIAPGGAGVLHSAGMTIFVDYTLPGEEIEVLLTEEHDSWAKGELLRIITPSPHRIAAPCPYYMACGGCTLQHIPYDMQLSIKKQIVIEHFSRIGGFESLPDLQILASAPFEYRNRMQFHRSPHIKAGQSKVGLKRKNSEQIIPITDCPIADPGIRLRLTSGTLVPPPTHNRFTVFSLGDLYLQEGVQNHGKVLLLGNPIHMDVSAFFQSNVRVLEAALKQVRAYAEAAGSGSRAADLYGGVGTFAHFIQDYFTSIDVMEQNPRSLNLARHNVRAKQSRLYALSDEAWAKMAIKNQLEHRYDFIIADPPRQGLSDHLRSWVCQSGSPWFVYVSCDPATLARDSKTLVTSGYQLTELTLFDFYPQTPHIECIALFRR
ncbi:MAG: class I SAM-dependent RNA methyltransferase [Termitinemataceae bacterium]